MRVLHIVGKALPTEVGYTLRTQAIAAAQREIGIDAIVVPCPEPKLYPGHTTDDGLSLLHVEGVPYCRLGEPRRIRRRCIQLSELARQRKVPGAYRLGSQLKLPHNAWQVVLGRTTSHFGKVDIVHAHTPAHMTSYARRFAEQLGVPLIYEVRGFWDLTAESTNSSEVFGQPIEEWVSLENEMCQAANIVATLGSAMRDELVERGVPRGKIEIFGNCVAPETFVRRPRDEQLRQELKIDRADFVAGYVTNVRPLEGLDTLIRATALLRTQGISVTMLLVGDGKVLDSLESLALELGVQQYCRFVGHVPHAEVQRYYSLFDVFVVPRTDQRVCRIVTPLKPLEAMALEIPTVVSNLPALKELAGEDSPWVFQADDPDSLASTILEVKQNPGRAREIALERRHWIEEQRSWKALAKKVQETYSTLCGSE